MIRLNETNPRLDRRNTFVDESHSGHVANYLVHDLVVLPALEGGKQKASSLPPPSPSSLVQDDRLSIPPRDRFGFSFESSLRGGGALRSALGKSSSRALELPFYDSRLSSRLARFKVDHDTIDLLTRHATMAKEHRIVLNTIRISLTPEGGRRRKEGGREGRFPFWKYASIVLQSAYLRHPRVDIT